MKLNSKSQLGLPVAEKMVEGIINSQWEAQVKNLDIELQRNTMIWLMDLFSVEMDKDIQAKNDLKKSGVDFNSFKFAINQNYLVAQTAIEMTKRIKIDEDKFDVKFLSKVKDQKITFLLGANKFIRYVKKAGVIFAIQVDTREVEEKGLYMDYTTFKINTITGDINYANKPIEPLTEPDFKFFVQLLVFTELSKLEIKILNPKEKFGTRKLGKYINESNQRVTVIDSVWNKMVVRTTGFNVSGHWRFQKCGKNFSEIEYIFIEEFRKKGYVRMPKKETTTESIN